MKVLHIEPNKPYEEVTLIADKVNKRNSLHVIEKGGQQFFTGGFILQNTPFIKKLLDNYPEKEQYSVIKKLRERPFIKEYLDD